MEITEEVKSEPVVENVAGPVEPVLESTEVGPPQTEDGKIEGTTQVSPENEGVKEEEDAIDKALANQPVEFSDTEMKQPPGPEEEDKGEESSDSDSDNSSSDEDDNNNNIKEAPNADEDLSDDDSKVPLKTKNEVEAPVPDLPSNFNLDEATPIEHVGTLTQVVDHTAVIQASISAEFRVLEDGCSVFCFEDKSVLGVLYETFGRVQSPCYTVKFKHDEDMERIKSLKGSTVFYVVPSSKFIFTERVRAVKGTDASNLHDEEIPFEEQEFSDDEAEQAAKQAKKKRKPNDKKRNNNNNRPNASRGGGGGMQPRPRHDWDVPPSRGPGGPPPLPPQQAPMQMPWQPQWNNMMGMGMNMNMNMVQMQMQMAMQMGAMQNQQNQQNQQRSNAPQPYHPPPPRRSQPDQNPDTLQYDEEYKP